MKPHVAFVLAGVTPQAVEAGVAITDDDLATLEELTERAGVDASILLACQKPETYGRKLTMAHLRAERDRLLTEIQDTSPAMTVAFGPLAVKALWDRGDVKESELRFRTHDIPGVGKVRAVASLEAMAMKTGLRTWAAIEVQRAVFGQAPCKLGEYHVQTDLHPDLRAFLVASPLGPVTVDLETYPGLNPMDPDARIRMAVVSHRSGWAQVVQATPTSVFPDWIQHIFADSNLLKVGSNIRFDVRWLRRFGYEVNNYVCSSHAEHLLDENSGMTDLKTMSLRYHPELGDYAAGQQKLVLERSVYGYKKTKTGKQGKRYLIEDGWRHIKDHEMYDYAGGDGDAGITIWQKQMERVEADGMKRPLAVMMRYYPAISELEMAGACVDMVENRALNERYVAELARLQQEARGLFGASVNLRSPQQLLPAIQESIPGVDLRKLWRRGDEDEYSTEAAVLRREAKKHPALNVVLEFRRRVALHNFVKKMPEHVVKVRSKDYVFSSLRGDKVATYRHSSSRPNLQNLPRTVESEAEAGLNPKRQYVSRFEGGSILELDYAALELREAGMIAKDQALITAFEAGEDVHTTLAAMMRGVPPEAITKQMRHECKVTNFHVLYGGGPRGLAMRLGCSDWAAEQTVKQFDETFTGYRKWERGEHRLLRKQGYVENRFGFRRRFPKPADWGSKLGRRILRQGPNAEIQGGASMHVYLGIARVVETFREMGLRSVPFMTVHDSLLIDVYPGEYDVVRQAAIECLENPFSERYGVDLTIPLKVDLKTGSSWGSLQEVSNTGRILS